MSKRIFTKYMSGAAADVSTGWTEDNAIEDWLMQEDIEIVGFQLGTRALISDQNDNLAEIIGELSQTGIISKEGVVGQVANAHYWNSVPASVDRECSTPIVMFPQGTAIPVKEEGHLYLNAICKGAAATHMTWLVWAIIYYTKRGA